MKQPMIVKKIPFLAKFGLHLPDLPAEDIHYDESRMVLVSGGVPVVLGSRPLPGDRTRQTLVDRETTDDN